MKRDIRKLKIAVLAGGISSEREVSIQSGNAVASALKEAEMNVVVSDIGPEDLKILDDRSIDVFFISLHGAFGEDGALQRILEDRCLVYTGSGPKASKVAFDKTQSKRAFQRHGIKTPRGFDFRDCGNTEVFKEKLRSLADQFVIKPACEGSSVGITITGDAGYGLEAAMEAYRSYGTCVVEEFISGRELTVGILSGRPLPIIEVKPRDGFYDYDSKYVDEGTAYLFDTIRVEKMATSIQAEAMKCFNALGCRGFGRVDLILDACGDVYVLEINTIPGFTSHSLLPMAAKRAGFSMSELCMEIISGSIEDKAVETPRTEKASGKLSIVETKPKGKRKDQSDNLSTKM